MEEIIKGLSLEKQLLDEDNIELYGYSENGSNDAPACDANGSTSNCQC